MGTPEVKPGARVLSLGLFCNAMDMVEAACILYNYQVYIAMQTVFIYKVVIIKIKYISSI